MSEINSTHEIYVKNKNNIDGHENQWSIGQPITQQKMTAISKELNFLSKEIDDVIKNNKNENAGIVNKIINGLFQYGDTNSVEELNNYTKFYVYKQNQTLNPPYSIEVPTIQDFYNFQENFVAPYQSNKIYYPGDHVIVNGTIYQILQITHQEEWSALDPNSYIISTMTSILNKPAEELKKITPIIQNIGTKKMLSNMGTYLSPPSHINGIIEQNATNGGEARSTLTATCAISPYIPVSKNDVIIMQNWQAAKISDQGTGGHLMCAFYTNKLEDTFVPDLDEQNKILSIGNGANTPKSYTYICKQDGYIRIGTSRADNLETTLENAPTAIIINHVMNDINSNFNTLQQDINSRIKIYTPENKDLFTIQKKTINSNGIIETNGNYISTNYIPVKKDQIVEYQLMSNKSNMIIAMYDSNYNYIPESGILGDGVSSPLSNGTYVCHNNGYIVACCLTTQKDNIILKIKNRVDNIEDSLDNLINNSCIDIDLKKYMTINQSVRGTNIDNDGIFIGNGSYLRTPFIPVKKGYHLVVSELSCSEKNRAVSFYTKPHISFFDPTVTNLIGQEINKKDTFTNINTALNIITQTFQVNNQQQEQIIATEISNNNYTATDFIQVTKGSIIKYNINVEPSYKGILICETPESASGTYIIKESISNTSVENTQLSGIYECKENVSIRVCCLTNQLENAQFSIIPVIDEGIGAGVQNSQHYYYDKIIPKDGYIVISSLVRNSVPAVVKANLKSELKYTMDEVIENVDAKDLINSLVKEGRTTLLQRNENHRCLNFTVIADTHMYQEAKNFSCKNNVRLFTEMAKYTDFAVHCGDVAESGNMKSTGLTTDDYVDKETNWNNYCEFIGMANEIKTPLYICHGNHDVSRHNDIPPGTNAITSQTWSIQSNRLTGNVIRNSLDPNSNYYYVDLDEFKCRIIVCDYWNQVNQDIAKGETIPYPTHSQGMNETEINWIQNVALNLSTKEDQTEWTILIFNHAKQLSSIASKINELRTKNDPIAIILIHGNDHKDDYTNNIFSEASQNSVKQYAGAYFNDIGVNKSFIKTWVSSDQRKIGTEEEYCVDIFSIDFIQKKIYEKRLGYGIDREYYFSPINSQDENYMCSSDNETICIDSYVNGTINAFHTKSQNIEE